MAFDTKVVLRVWHSHYACIVYEDVYLGYLRIDLLSCFSYRRGFIQFDWYEDHFDVGVDICDLVGYWLDFTGAAGEENDCCR